MKIGFTPRESYSVYRSLSREVFSNYGYDRPITYRSIVYPASYNALGMTDFASRPNRENPFAPNFSGPAEHAWLISLNRVYLPHMYEDELIGTILHELAHVVAGFSAGHGHKWSSLAKEIGGHHIPDLLIRNWLNLPAAYLPSSHFVEVNKGGKPDYA